MSGDDYARLGAHTEEFVLFDGNRAYMRMVAGHCSALNVNQAERSFTCGTYETRPQVCRDLARGGGACRAELESKQVRPLLVLGLPAKP